MAASDRRRLRGALGEMAPEFREALVLREMEGFSYREIATITGVPMGTVMSRLSRGREWLKRLLTAPDREAAGR
jgi:RNA polymerase sigma-70 factor (ECF subfamily)